ncbi:nuclear transport factor 2 family protein [uncultured Sneathiella sp.]|uniref:nuclear transport factor 2 family protein n=1 Tax=uncultured Sneathiella sp. TaxID=879315 RepID=UPI00259AA3BC|nr:nuclear transport factor 2 family protein [uncultured Sneathiella sp.]
MIKDTVAAWHDCIGKNDPELLDALLHEEATFHSPVVFTPQQGKKITGKYLMAAFRVLNGDDFKYVREIVGSTDAVLEFTTTIDGIVINGVDLIQWGEDGRITDFKVMIRPLKAINLVHQKMAELLAQSG